MRDGGERSADDPSHPDPALQHQGHLPRAESRQRPVPGRRRQRRGLHPRPDRAGPRHPRERRRRRCRGPGRQGDGEHQDAGRGGGRLAGGHRQGRRLPHRHPLPRAGLPDHGQVA